MFASQANILRRSRVYFDFSKVTVSIGDGSEFESKQKHWKSIVGEAAGKKWCDCTQTKSGMVERMHEFPHALKQPNITIKTF